MENTVEVQNLTKKFSDITAVDDLSFTIQKGDIYGFLGQNGAGKSTTIRMLVGLVHPTSGEILMQGDSFSKNKKRMLSNIGAMIERPDLYGYLSAMDNLKMFAKLSKKDFPSVRLEEVLVTVGLTGREHDKVKTYSQGMKQRLGIAIALVHDPELLILDEPTNGLDPQGIAEMRELIRNLGTQLGKTIIISSHLLHEVEQIANRMLVIHKGRKVSEGKVSELLNPNETLMEVRILPDDSIEEKLRAKEWGEYIVESNSSALVFKMHPRKMPRLNKYLVDEQVHVLEIRSKHSLEEYFLTLTNQADVEN
ncbi:MAG: ABC transporter ATP-binding protein [Chitinophagales bacterium]|nr:ABC transporter ATP-binding protein [Chitinophagaceae bacterium]MCB9064491.1 ABC transporter ATP-binding protein [Chitinophagales bacterium]